MSSRDCESYDVAVLGSGFAGTLIALIARRIGHNVLLVERGRHPRFAIGESSTPLANLKLAVLCDRYGLDGVKPFTKYGSWKRERPDVACGLKRGFSFFRHQSGRRFTPNAEHDNELLVAANPSEELSDTHWLRSEFDAWLVREAVRQGVHYVERCDLHAIEPRRPWLLRGRTDEGLFEARCGFLIDGTGDGRCLAASLGLRSNVDTLRTRTRVIYSHFVDVRPWSDVYAEAGGDVGAHPFPCDAAALHHIIDGGWMWVLRFDNGVTSAGFSLDPTVHPYDPTFPAEEEWERLIRAYPSIDDQFRAAFPVRPLTRTDRIQRRLAEVSGEDWALLPHTACFLDPWLSSGIAYSMYGIERLARVLEAPESDRAELLTEYSRRLGAEAELFDRIIAACCASFDAFEKTVAITMAYFCAAIFSEERIRAGHDDAEAGFLLAGDERFASIVDRICEEASKLTADPAEFADRVASWLVPYNTAGLCDPRRRNMYPYLQS